ncbi:MAG: hypothetical protein AB7N71_09340 [Phycisphaerae bacterium]
MQPSLRALLSDIVDYAGLYPPAELPLDAAIRTFAADRQSPEADMLARFVIPAAKLQDLAPYKDELFAANPGFRFSVLGGGGETLDDFAGAIDQMREQIHAFYAIHGSNVRVEATELRLPALIHDRDATDLTWLQKKITSLWQTPAGRIPSFLEVPPGPAWNETMEFAAFSDFRAQFGDGLPPADAPFGFKLRTGGVTADAFPPIERVAHTIAVCRDRAVPIKFTAGLHHPIRHHNNSVATKMHGFINVFAAAALAAHFGTERFNETKIANVLQSENSEDFLFDASGLTWHDHHIPTDAIETVRRRFAISFGSCSFDEPRDDLRALGWM